MRHAIDDEARTWIQSDGVLPIHNIGTRLRKSDLAFLDCATSVANVAGKHIWKLFNGGLPLHGVCSRPAAVTLSGDTIDLYSSTVLIHLSVAEEVEPRPGEQHCV